MSSPTLEERTLAYSQALPELGESPANAEIILTALTSVKVRDALLKTLSESEHITKAIAIDTLFEVGTEAYGEVVTDWTPELLAMLAGLSMLQFEHNDAQMYANAGADKGNHLCRLISRAFSGLPPQVACSIFTDSMRAVTLDECLEDTE